MRFLSDLLVFGLLACFVPMEASAQLPCRDEQAARETLADRYHEIRRGWGISTTGNLIEVFSAVEGDRSWTIIKQTPGQSIVCAQAVGSGGTSYPLDNGMEPDSAGRVLVWRGFGKSRVSTFMYEIFVNETDKAWKIKRTTRGTGAVQIMADGVQWTETDGAIGSPI